MLDLEFYAPVAFSSSVTPRFGIPTRSVPSSSALKTEEPSLKRVVLGLSGSLVKNAAAATLCSLFEPSV